MAKQLEEPRQFKFTLIKTATGYHVQWDPSDFPENMRTGEYHVTEHIIVENLQQKLIEISQTKAHWEKIAVERAAIIDETRAQANNWQKVAAERLLKINEFESFSKEEPMPVLSDKPEARLENWYVGGDDLLFGNVYGHSRIPDGEFVRTSRVVTWNKEINRAVTRNTNYILGQPK